MKNFTHLLRVRYSECDSQKVVFNAKYAEFIDVAATEFMREIWGNYNDVLQRGLDSQVVNLNITWQAPASFDDVLAIGVRTNHVGNSSYTLAFTISNYVDDKEVATAEVVYVMVDANTFTKISIPDDLRKKLIQDAPAVIVNHSGV